MQCLPGDADLYLMTYMIYLWLALPGRALHNNGGQSPRRTTTGEYGPQSLAHRGRAPSALGARARYAALRVRRSSDARPGKAQAESVEPLRAASRDRKRLRLGMSARSVGSRRAIAPPIATLRACTP